MRIKVAKYFNDKTIVENFNKKIIVENFDKKIIAINFDEKINDEINMFVKIKKNCDVKISFLT